MAESIYLDHHSTTPLDPRVLERMLPYFSEKFGNPASITHPQGRQAATALENARAAIAEFLGARPNEIYFTSGATESNNIAIRGFRRGTRRHIVTTAIEHKSVLVPARMLESEGFEVTAVTPDREGFVTRPDVEAVLRDDTLLVSVGAANSEIGTIQPVGEIAELCRSRGVLFHTDATQAVGKTPLELSNCDLLSMSAHKIYGPKGIGALMVRRGIAIDPLVVGGGQEKGLRSGTVNVPGAIGLAAALELRRVEMAREADELTELRNFTWDRLVSELDGVFVNGPRELRLPGNLNVTFTGVDSEALLLALRNFALSSGSACSSGEREPSYVLRAIGLDDRQAMGSIRVGMGRGNTKEQMQSFLADVKVAVGRVRQFSI